MSGKLKWTEMSDSVTVPCFTTHHICHMSVLTVLLKQLLFLCLTAERGDGFASLSATQQPFAQARSHSESSFHLRGLHLASK